MSNKQPRKHKRAAGPAAGGPPQRALPAEPRATEPNAPADTPPTAKRRRAKPTASAAPAADASQSSGMPAKPLATPTAASQLERATAADTLPSVAKRRAKPNAAAAPVAASHSSGMPARPLALSAAGPQLERVPAADTPPRMPAPVAQHSQIKPAATDASAFVKAIPRSGATRPDPAPTIVAPAPKTVSRASLRERIPLSNDAISVFAMSAIFLIGLLLGFVLLEKNVQALEARAPGSALIAHNASAKPDITPTNQPATAEPAIEQRPAALLVSTPVSTLPTSVPAPTPPLPTAPPSVAELLQRVAAAEQTLSAGTIEAMLDYRNGSSASAQLRFDIGSAGQKPRFWIKSTYTGTSGSQVIERLTIGDQGWDRHPDGRWLAGQPQGAITEQLRVYLPQSDQITQAEQSSDSNTTTLRWYDASRDADMTLMIDQATGVPRELRRIARANGVKLVVVYAQWNAPVDIAAPPEG